MKKPDPKIIREDDQVRVIVPKFVERVGYPKTVKDYIPEVRDSALGKEIEKFFQVHWSLKYKLQRERVERELAYVLAKRDRFGGPERSLHWIEKSEYAGQVMYVRRVVTRMTGWYYPPSGHYDDYEPGGLNNMKSHRLAVVRPIGCFICDRRDELMIPVGHIEKIR